MCRWSLVGLRCWRRSFALGGSHLRAINSLRAGALSPPHPPPVQHTLIYNRLLYISGCCLSFTYIIIAPSLVPCRIMSCIPLICHVHWHSCPTGCTQCGGAGCGSSGELGFDGAACCINGILDSQPECSITRVAPCVIGEGTTAVRQIRLIVFGEISHVQKYTPKSKKEVRSVRE